MDTVSEIPPEGKSIAVIGVGGNIGSHLAPHLARMSGIDRIVLVDPDAYEAKNLTSQDITPQAVGRRKVAVQAERLHRVNSALRIVTIAEAVENVPLGRLRGDVILACLDSRRARCAVNEIAFRLGVPLIDAGVEPGGLLARIEVYAPGSHDAPCLECGMDDSDYALLEQRYPCGGEEVENPATNAPSSLGALAASLQAIECQKLLAGRSDQVLAGRQVLIDAAHHKHYVTKLARRTDCRFDHATWSIARGECRSPDCTVAEALDLNGVTASRESPIVLRVEGKAFVTSLACGGCGRIRKTLRLQGRLRTSERKCTKCGGELTPVGFEMREELDEAMPRSVLRRPLHSLGLMAGDVFSIGNPRGDSRHYEIGHD